MLPIVLRATHPRYVYVRVHRRVGTDRKLTPAELAQWAHRIAEIRRLNPRGQFKLSTDRCIQRLPNQRPE